MEQPDIRIGQVDSEIVVTDGIGALSQDEVRKLAALVLDLVKQEQDRQAQHADQTTIRDRAYRPT
jgi:hypothetical protein